MLGKIGKGVKNSKSPLDITNFITKMAIGALAFFVKNADKIREYLKL